ncbi:unnamed protein product, partial [Nesidiocoris tenuis]
MKLEGRTARPPIRAAAIAIPAPQINTVNPIRNTHRIRPIPSDRPLRQNGSPPSYTCGRG